MRHLVYVFLLSATPLAAAKGFWQHDHIVEVNRPDVSAEEQFAKAIDLAEQERWHEAVEQLRLVRTFYSDTPYAKEALYQTGRVYFYLGELHVANGYYSRYLSEQHLPEHFLDVVEYKFKIAESYREGRRRPLFGSNNLPKWSSGRLEALEIYDEIAACLPSSEIAAHSLFNKGQLLSDMRQYLEAVEAFQDVVMRFPGHPLSADSYINIAACYMAQSRLQSQDPDLLALARLNVRRFRQEYPFDERIAEAERCLGEMQEILAEGLIATARFWEKKRKVGASAIYYRTAISSYPMTRAAKEAEERLAALNLDESGTS